MTTFLLYSSLEPWPMTMTAVFFPGVRSSSTLSARISPSRGSSPKGCSMWMATSLPSHSQTPSVASLGSPKCFMGKSLVMWRPDATKNGRMTMRSYPSLTISVAASASDGKEVSLNPT